MTYWSPSQMAFFSADRQQYYDRHPGQLRPHEHRQVVERVVALMGQPAYLEWLNADPANADRVEEKLMELYMVQFRYGAW